jgi:hypothetical protein
MHFNAEYYHPHSRVLVPDATMPWTRQAKLLVEGNESEFKHLFGSGGVKDASAKRYCGRGYGNTA